MTIGRKSFAFQSFQPYLWEEDGAGCLLIGLRCSQCQREFYSVNLESDTNLFRQVVNHVCTPNV